MIAAGKWMSVKKKGDPKVGGRYLIIYKIKIKTDDKEVVEKHFDVANFRPGAGWVTGFSPKDMKIIAWAEPKFPDDLLTYDYSEVYAA